MNKWLKYALIAAGVYLLYQQLQKQQKLGEYFDVPPGHGTLPGQTAGEWDNSRDVCGNPWANLTDNP